MRRAVLHCIYCLHSLYTAAAVHFSTSEADKNTDPSISLYYFCSLLSLYIGASSKWRRPTGTARPTCHCHCHLEIKSPSSCYVPFRAYVPATVLSVPTSRNTHTASIGVCSHHRHQGLDPSLNFLLRLPLLLVFAPLLFAC